MIRQRKSGIEVNKGKDTNLVKCTNGKRTQIWINKMKIQIESIDQAEMNAGST